MRRRRARAQELKSAPSFIITACSSGVALSVGLKCILHHTVDREIFELECDFEKQAALAGRKLLPEKENKIYSRCYRESVLRVRGRDGERMQLIRIYTSLCLRVLYRLAPVWVLGFKYCIYAASAVPRLHTQIRRLVCVFLLFITGNFIKQRVRLSYARAPFFNGYSINELILEILFLSF